LLPCSNGLCNAVQLSSDIGHNGLQLHMHFVILVDEGGLVRDARDAVHVVGIGRM